MDDKEIIGEQLETERKKNLFFNTKNILNFLLIIIVINLVGLDITLLNNGFIKTVDKKIQNPSVQIENQTCPQSCVSSINKALLTKPTPYLSQIPTPAVVKTNELPKINSVREYYIPFGSGSGNSNGWEDVPGLEAYIDSSAYGTIKSVIFEASLHVPTGNETASLRLYDATDNHPVWNSQIDFNGSTSSVFLSSQPINLDSGNKLYKVQIITQLQYTAVLDQSRLHITTQ